jgi:hypothetical protein
MTTYAILDPSGDMEVADSDRPTFQFLSSYVGWPMKTMRLSRGNLPVAGMLVRGKGPDGTVEGPPNRMASDLLGSPVHGIAVLIGDSDALSIADLPQAWLDHIRGWVDEQA